MFVVIILPGLHSNPVQRMWLLDCYDVIWMDELLKEVYSVGDINFMGIQWKCMSSGQWEWWLLIVKCSERPV